MNTAIDKASAAFAVYKVKTAEEKAVFLETITESPSIAKSVKGKKEKTARLKAKLYSLTEQYRSLIR